MRKGRHTSKSRHKKTHENNKTNEIQPFPPFRYSQPLMIKPAGLVRIVGVDFYQILPSLRLRFGGMVERRMGRTATYSSPVGDV